MRSCTPILIAILTPLLAGSCRLGEAGGIVGVHVPGAAARVFYQNVQWAGGHGHTIRITVDSATSRFEVMTCTSGVTGPTCEETAQTHSGDVLPGTLQLLFETPQSPSFRGLRGEYRRSGDIIPPDGGGSRLTITVAERERTITWESGVTVPELLQRYVCWMDSVRGSFINCG